MKPAPPPKPIRSPDTYPLHEKEVESQEDLHKEEVDEVDTAFDTSDGDFNQIIAFHLIYFGDIYSPFFSPANQHS